MRFCALLTLSRAVVIVGPRQVGKTSLAKQITDRLQRPSLYLDLELPEDYGKLSNPSLFLDQLGDQTVIIDEVQRQPALFPVLWASIDRRREPGRFILLGSASPELIRDSSESLAGRVAYFELPPLTYQEVNEVVDYQTHWLRGGFPESLLVTDQSASLEWRENFVQTYLERDLPLLGLRAEPMLIRRLWTMLAHLSGNLLNLESLAGSLSYGAHRAALCGFFRSLLPHPPTSPVVCQYFKKIGENAKNLYPGYRHFACAFKHRFVAATSRPPQFGCILGIIRCTGNLRQTSAALRTRILPHTRWHRG